MPGLAMYSNDVGPQYETTWATFCSKAMGMSAPLQLPCHAATEACDNVTKTRLVMPLQARLLASFTALGDM